MTLAKYQQKRDFRITSEPSGKREKRSTSNKGEHLQFVVQKHAASHLHFDFRLEHNGVLLSWAIPKGPSANPADKRLAVQVEDHPFEYRNFEGRIPEGYGAGEVIIWDRGTFTPELKSKSAANLTLQERTITAGMKQGKLDFILNGERLKGAWSLIKLGAGKPKSNWLLIKQRDEFVDNFKLSQEKTSVLSGKSVEDLAESSKPSASSGFEELDQVIETIKGSKKTSIEIEFAGSKLSFTNLDKVLWPGVRGNSRVCSKRDYLIYMCAAAPFMLPHLLDRPLTLIRYPNGVTEKHFFQKHAENAPDFVERISYYSENADSNEEFIVCNNLQTLLWLAQMSALELHTVHARINAEPDGLNLGRTFSGSLENIKSSLLNYPDYLVLDLDPYIYSGKEQSVEPELNKNGFKKTIELALQLKEILDDLKLRSFVKTSGMTGLHIYVPIIRNVDNDQVREYAKTLATHIRKQYPDLVTIDWSVKKRTGKIFVDYNMNARGKTLSAPYSARHSLSGTVSMPVEWAELDSIFPTEFTLRTVPTRLKNNTDLWRNILSFKNNLLKLQ